MEPVRPFDVLLEVRDMVDEFFRMYHAVNEVYSVVNDTKTVFEPCDEAKALTERLAKISFKQVACKIALAVKELSTKAA